MAKAGTKPGTKRPDLSKYDPKKTPVQAHKLCLLGATNEQLADFFEVNEETIYRWQREHPEFKEALADGKIAADAEIANALYHRARGFSHIDTKMFMDRDADGNSTILTKTYLKHYPPDTTACKWWLNNRQKEKWQDKQEIDMTIKGDKGSRLLTAKKRVADERKSK